MSEHNPDGLPEMDGFRFLHIGETFMEGDQYWDHGLWVRSDNWRCEGRRVSAIDLTYRRRVSPASAERETAETDSAEDLLLQIVVGLRKDDGTDDSSPKATKLWILAQKALTQVKTLRATNAALTRELSELRADKERLDQLERLTVNVRQPMVHGSMDLFWASPKDNDGDEQPSDIRAQLDALRGAKDGKGAA
jgi:hypothetical protein